MRKKFRREMGPAQRWVADFIGLRLVETVVGHLHNIVSAIFMPMSSWDRFRGLLNPQHLAGLRVARFQIERHGMVSG